MGGLRALVAGLDAAVGRAEAWVLGALVAAMTFTSFLQVICRYVFNSPLVWSEELARYLFVWIGLVGAGAAVRTGGHFGLDLLVRNLPAVARPWAGGLVSAVVTVFAATLLVQGLRETAQASLQSAFSLPFRMHWAYAAIPAGSALMLWHLAARWVVAGFGSNPSEPH